MIEVLVTIAIIVLLAMLILPELKKARSRARSICCNCNLKQIGLGIRQWGMDHGDRYPAQVSVTNGGVMELVENGYVASCFLVTSNELNTPVVLWCPTETQNMQAKTFANGLGNSNVSYFIALDADETQPQMFLTGDDNFLVNGQPVNPGVLALATNTPVAWSTARHNKQGNVGMADGSVQGFSNSKLQEALINTGTNIVRLAFP